MSLNRTRQVTANQVIADQADFFQGDNYTRIINLAKEGVQLKVFWNNQLQPWFLADGATITDALVVSGYVYWLPIPGAPGYYGVRWRPMATGYWRIVVNYPDGAQFAILEYDVVPEASASLETGLRASFSKY